jgi:hypothetical protein
MKAISSQPTPVKGRARKSFVHKQYDYAESVYPTLDQIEVSSRTQLGYWMRYLPSPGESGIGHDNFADLLATESAALDMITMRFKSKGGWSPRVSKNADLLNDERKIDEAMANKENER